MGRQAVSKITIPVNERTLAVARRTVWDKTPEETLARPAHFLAHLMTHGLSEDIMDMLAMPGKETFREALRQAPPGIFDARSWNYWHIALGMTPVPPRPVHPLFKERHQSAEEDDFPFPF